MNDEIRIAALMSLIFKAKEGELPESIPPEHHDGAREFLTGLLRPKLDLLVVDDELEKSPDPEIVPVEPEPEPIEPVTEQPAPVVETSPTAVPGLDFTLPYSGRVYGNPQDGIGIQNSRIDNDQAHRFLADFDGIPKAYSPTNRTLNQPNIDDRGKKGLDYYEDCFKHGLGPDRCGFILPSCYHVGNGGSSIMAIVEDDGTKEHKPSDNIVARVKDLYSPTDYRNTPAPELIFDAETAGRLHKGELYHFVHLNQKPAPVVSRMSVSDAKKTDITVGAQGLNGLRIGHHDNGHAGYGDICAIHFRNSSAREWRLHDARATPWHQLLIETVQGMIRTGNTLMSFDAKLGQPHVKTIGGNVVGRQRFTVLDATRRVTHVNVSHGHTEKSNGKPMTAVVHDLTAGYVLGVATFTHNAALKKLNRSSEFLKRNARRWNRAAFEQTIELIKGHEIAIEFVADDGADFVVPTMAEAHNFRNQRGEKVKDRNHWLESVAEISENGGRSWGPWSGKGDAYKSHRVISVYFNVEGMPLDVNLNNLQEYQSLLKGAKAEPVEPHKTLASLSVKETKGDNFKIAFSFGEGRPGRLEVEDAETKTLTQTNAENSSKWGGDKPHQQWIRGVKTPKRIWAQTTDNGRDWYRVGDPITVNDSSTEAAGSYIPDLQTSGDLRTALKQDFNYAQGEGLKIKDGIIRHTFIPTDKGSVHVQGSASIDSGYREYTVSQSMRFAKDFKPMRGGKCGFGLFGRSSGEKVAGHVVNRAGWSCRVMWRPSKKKGHLSLVLYTYNADRDLSNGKKYGDDNFITDAPLVDLFNLDFTVSLNTSASESNGFMSAGINGNELLRVDGIRWQAEGTPGDGMELEYTGMFGGNDKSWAPPSNQYMEISDVFCSWK